MELSILEITGIATVALLIPPAGFYLAKLCKWWRPIKIKAEYCRDRLGHGSDEIRATITNLTNEVQVLVRCEARGVCPVKYGLMKHIKSPFLSPKLYETIWRSVLSYPLVVRDDITLPAKQPRTYATPISRSTVPGEVPVFEREFQVEVELSGGRKFRSSRVSAPKKGN